MSRIKFYAPALGVIVIIVSVLAAVKIANKESEYKKGYEQALMEMNKQLEDDLKLGQYVINMMHATRRGSQLSGARKLVLAQSIVRVCNAIFDTFENKKAFIMAIAIESEFVKYAQSPTGPKGLTQVAKSAFYEGMAKCGMKDLHDEDVWETEINLYAGACYFKSLLDKAGDPGIAIVAYNQGPNSDAAKRYAATGHLDNMEALKYVAKFTFLTRTVSEERSPNAPAIDELQKPVPQSN